MRIKKSSYSRLQKPEHSKNFSLKVKERLLDKHLYNQEEGTGTERTNYNEETKSDKK
jgi:hypothetical protein